MKTFLKVICFFFQVHILSSGKNQSSKGLPSSELHQLNVEPPCSWCAFRGTMKSGNFSDIAGQKFIHTFLWAVIFVQYSSGGDFKKLLHLLQICILWFFFIFLRIFFLQPALISSFQASAQKMHNNNLVIMGECTSSIVTNEFCP